MEWNNASVQTGVQNTPGLKKERSRAKRPC